MKKAFYPRIKKHTMGATPVVKKRWSIKRRFSRIFFQRLLFVGCFLSLLYGIVRIDWGWSISHISFINSMTYWSSMQLTDELDWVKERNFFTLSVHEVADQLAMLPLIHVAQVRKKWPDRLLISVQEDHPVAVWNDVAFLTKYAKKTPRLEAVETVHLPKLYGLNEQETRVKDKFYQLESLLEPLGVGVQSMSLILENWVLVLDNGWHIRLGRHDLLARMSRLTKLLALLPEEKVKMVDLRYGKGAAVQWRLM